MKSTLTKIVWMAVVLTQLSCEKAFLDARPDKALVVPETLADFQSILDNTAVMNVAPALNEVSADDFQPTAVGWMIMSEIEKNCYTWQPDLFANQQTAEWNAPYQQVFYANTVLDGLSALPADAADQKQRRHLEGAALFYRAIAFYHLAQLFAAPYQASDAQTQLGIPLRLTSTVQEKSLRSSLQQSYDQIISDLKKAANLLPDKADYKSRPSKAAAFALLSRVHLSMQFYDQAASFADSCLSIQPDLINYSVLDSTSAWPFPAALPNGNSEVLFHTSKIAYLYGVPSFVVIDPALYNSYDSQDLRRVLFFNNRGAGNINFKGSYNSSLNTFSGLATDEVYLIRAECSARSGNTAGAVRDLDQLLESRYKKGSYKSVSGLSQTDLLSRIITERRKELVGRGLRWADLRRLNLEERFKRPIQRTISGQSYSLMPNDSKYVFPIPANELAASGIPQNVRN
jgi:tetratricopeptide (TPR) repeat protein